MVDRAVRNAGTKSFGAEAVGKARGPAGHLGLASLSLVLVRWPLPPSAPQPGDTGRQSGTGVGLQQPPRRIVICDGDGTRTSAVDGTTPRARVGTVWLCATALEMALDTCEKQSGRPAAMIAFVRKEKNRSAGPTAHMSSTVKRIKCTVISRCRRAATAAAQRYSRHGAALLQYRL